MKKIITTYACVFILTVAFAQSYDTIQTQPIIIANATIHIGDGTVIENGIIAFEKRCDIICW